MTTDVRAAYRRCEEITWSQARNFSYGIRLLPPAKRQALAAVYAFARRIDDIGDGTLPAPQKLTLLEEARGGLSALQAGQVDDGDEVLVALADAAARFDIPLPAFGELIDGCAADVRGVRYATFDDLLHYCRCVAGSIGRLSLGVFGTSDPQQAVPLADSLGVALQLTNILRDIREDYATGRVYLPAEDFARFGCALGGSFLPAPGDGSAGALPPPFLPAPGDGSAGALPPPFLPAPGDGSAGALPALFLPAPGDRSAGALPPPATDPQLDKLTALVEFEADRARTWYAKGLALMPLLDRRSAASAGAMAGIYYRLLEHIAASPAAVLTRRVSLSAREKAAVAVKSVASAAVRPPRRRPRPSAAAPGAAR